MWVDGWGAKLTKETGVLYLQSFLRLTWMLERYGSGVLGRGDADGKILKP